MKKYDQKIWKIMMEIYHVHRESFVVKELEKNDKSS